MLDVNDNTPKFLSPASVSVREDTPQGTVLLTVVTRDPDAGQNGTVVYKIIAGNEQGMKYSTFVKLKICDSGYIKYLYLRVTKPVVKKKTPDHRLRVTMSNYTFRLSNILLKCAIAAFNLLPSNYGQ